MKHLRPSRREVLQWAAAGSAWLLAPACRSSSPTQPPPNAPTFFTDDQRQMLAALADVAVPPDDGLVGGSALGTTGFVERLLTSFETADATPFIYVAGPSSNRNPIPDADGKPTQTPSEDDFLTALPLGRAGAYAWKLYLYGSDGVGGGPNDAVLGKVIGLRDQMQQGLQNALATLKKPVGELNVADKAAAFAALPDPFRQLVIDLTIQACWCAPEYGGNADLGGWTLVHYEGDVEPYGYTQWDAATQKMIERADAPVSTPNPGTDPVPLDDQARKLISTVVQALGGKEFS